MTSKLLSSGFVSYVLYLVVYSFSSTLSTCYIDQFLLENNIDYAELDDLKFYKFFGYLSSAFLLMIGGQGFSPKKILILAFSFYVMGIIVILYISGYSPINAIKFYNFAIAISSSTFFIIILNDLLFKQISLSRPLLSRVILVINSDESQNISESLKIRNALTVFFISIFIGYLISEIFLNGLGYPKDRKIIILTTIPIISMLLFTIIRKQFRIKMINRQTNFNFLIQNIKLEAISVYAIFYVLMIILDGYKPSIIIDHLMDANITPIKYFAFGAIIAGVYLIPIIIQSCNLYKVNICCLSLLIILFFLVTNWKSYFFVNSSIWISICLLLYALLISNIMILAEKFESFDLYSVIFICYFLSSIGFYLGYITVKSFDNYIISKNGFLISIYFVLLSLIIYYTLRFKKDKLGRW